MAYRGDAAWQTRPLRRLRGGAEPSLLRGLWHKKIWGDRGAVVGWRVYGLAHVAEAP
jgi:hypothetical protein